MPAFSDDLRLGPVFIPVSDTTNPSPMAGGVGPMGRTYTFDVVPASSGTTTGQNQLSVSANLPAGNLVLTAGTGVTAVTDATGVVRYTLDCARNIAIYSAADHSGSTLLVSGYDQYGQAMSELITGPNATTVQGAKCFKSVTSIFSSGAIASACVVGLGTWIGLPYRLTDLGYVMSVMFNQVAITISGTAVTVADVTSPATTTTTDVRGKINCGQTDNAKRLIVNYALPALACGPNATRLGAVGVQQV